MKLVEMNWNPSDRQLRQFGIICLIALPLLGWLWGGSSEVVGSLAAMGLAIALAGTAAPKTVKPLFLLLTIVATPLGMAIGELMLLVIYFGVFLPIGLCFRLAGRDALHMTIDRKAATYWQPKRHPGSVADYYHQS